MVKVKNGYMGRYDTRLEGVDKTLAKREVMETIISRSIRRTFKKTLHCPTTGTSLVIGSNREKRREEATRHHGQSRFVTLNSHLKTPHDSQARPTSVYGCDVINAARPTSW